MRQYNFILDASAFDRGLGNVQRWCKTLGAKSQPDRSTKSKRNQRGKSKGEAAAVAMGKGRQEVQLNLYIPMYTLAELDYLKFKQKSFNARESLKFIDELVGGLGEGETTEQGLHVELEYEEVLDLIPWEEVNIHGIESLNKLPRRLKNLLKSCVYKYRLEGSHGLSWIFVVEDPQVKEYAIMCDIPCATVVQVDATLSQDLQDKSFQANERFNKILLKNAVQPVDTTEGGNVRSPSETVVKTRFDKTMYAARGSGKLWTP
ncbi:Nmd4p KNAG_0B05890 [Huiozyma naganishii CBS 8797]|uniref:PIN domain-containing protein n=1 Tax=Huiozyma naganishii (strain ATCC MYA-139 / BCRC 22969 / CBS 8797 / KCTC 17520 / NBRC 10181 / NCYC 3082 / Yp74L-3) TaxID=1071383 RepID=J7R2I8_HUIN7|nr:hypothetical protein KNAG_0B05890 [Kazachstania naganishii CBS 8797]CCK69020.1 hypothetical protein KNAG_0B05890 [Kazachstania naganishii CBS 8797]